MKKKGEGHIVNVGSMSAKVRETGSDVYVATKSGIEAFTDLPDEAGSGHPSSTSATIREKARCVLRRKGEIWQRSWRK